MRPIPKPVYLKWRVFVCALVFAPLAAPAQETTVGSAVVSENIVRISYGDVEKPLIIGDDVVFGASINTGADSGNVDALEDGTRITVAADSKIVVDEFVFDPNTTAGELALRLTKGAIRFVSGRLPSKNYEIRTPNAYLGIRGTTFVLAYSLSLGTTLYVEEGIVEISGPDGEGVSVAAGQASGVASGQSSASPASEPGPAAALAVASVNVSVAVSAAPSVALPEQLSITAEKADLAASIASSAEAVSDDASFGGDGNY